MSVLKELYTREYMQKVFYFCLKKTSDEFEAQDLTSEISLCVIAELQKGTVPAHFSAWVWQIAKNRYSGWAKRKRKNKDLVVDADISDYEISQSALIENELILSEDISLLRRELAFISSDYRDIVSSFYLEDTKTKDIALKLGLPESTVRGKLHRARKILKEGMSMAREFGTKSYKPEDINFCASGSQPTGLPWSAVQRRTPKNILIQASENPSTVGELSIELGIALPYMEEEVELLVQSTLLNKVGDKYVTSFYIEDSQTQTKIFTTLVQGSRELHGYVDRIAQDMIPQVRAAGAVRNSMTDMEVKWWLVIHTVDYCISQLDKYNIYNPVPRSNGETWGFIGYEKSDLPKSLVMGHNGIGDGQKMFWAYKINGYNMRNRVGEMTRDQVSLLADLLRNNRNISSLTDSEKPVWRQIDGKFAHADTDGAVIADILVFMYDDMSKLDKKISNHIDYKPLMEAIEAIYEKINAIIGENASDILSSQLTYCTSMDILSLRMAVVYDEVDSGGLTVPADPEKSTVAMDLQLK